MNHRFFIIVICILLFLLWQTYSNNACDNDLEDADEEDGYSSAPLVEEEKPLPCYNLPGAEDTVVIIKTGSTEFTDKLPRHLNTTHALLPELPDLLRLWRDIRRSADHRRA